MDGREGGRRRPFVGGISRLERAAGEECVFVVLSRRGVPAVPLSFLAFPLPSPSLPLLHSRSSSFCSWS